MKYLLTVILLVNTAYADKETATFTCSGEKESEITCEFGCLKFGEEAGISCNKKKQFKCMTRCLENNPSIPCLKRCEKKALCDKKNLELINLTKPILNCEGK